MRLRSTAGAPPQMNPGGTAASRPRARDSKGFARLAVEHGFMAEADVARIEAHARAEGLALHDAAVDLGLLDSEDAAMLAALQGGFALLPMGDPRVDPLVAAAFDPADPYAAKIRTIRSKMRAVAKNGDPTALRLAVLSVDAGDEGAIVAANLAVVLAQMDGPTMAVDVDMERPSLDRLFRVANKAGLAEQLIGSAALLPAAKTAVDGLWLMTAGRASGSASSLVTRGPLAETASGWGLRDMTMLFYLAERKGDQTPYGSILAGFDAVTLIVRRGETGIAAMRRVIDELDRHGVPIAGTVIA
ncbi:MAG TPA: capsular biosynthesis protein [Sphingobium sp.]|uniref:capsular biosynthesis protein n=1 Tax=unclassified Sphingobium TaxID=2611147 RepID=UPI0007F33A11|nr:MULTISPECIES: capsular biosynthesis protein [unclassified Sphingobium]OAN57767.1 capsular biosynthesis protein [Sphingobium sp. TCM1]WIW87577.1 capsular biosynthesis protein [Sphingobium sp. V4]HAF41916.1 capsular biosynthesis protein [Sphingobium sp.]